MILFQAAEEVSNELRIKVRFEASYSVQQAVEAVLKLLEISGGAALHDYKEVQLHLRGLLGMKLHPFAIWENMAAPYSAVIFGLPSEAPLMKNTSRMPVLKGRRAWWTVWKCGGLFSQPAFQPGCILRASAARRPGTKPV